MAFVGLMLEAFETKRPVVLPRIRVMDQLARIHRPLDFGAVFEQAPMLDFCARNGIAVVARDPRELPQGYDPFFWKTYHVLQRMPTDPGSPQSLYVEDLVRALRPRVRATFLLRSLRRMLAELDRDCVVAQVRIEHDWKKHCEENLGRTAPPDEENYLPFEAIVGKIAATLGDVRTVFVLCDETAMPLTKDDMRALAANRHNVECVFKSDYISDFERELMTELHLSLLDFELATYAERFVGLSRSTFSCLATLEKYCRDGRRVRDHYLYNMHGPRLRERTDNGFYWDARQATA